MTWLEDPPPWLPPCLLLCFASVIVWTENKNFTISDHWPLYLFYFDSETISAALEVFMFWGRRLKKRSSTFFRKKCTRGWPGSRMFWPRNDLAPLLRWRRHWLLCDDCYWLTYSIVSLLSAMRTARWGNKSAIKSKHGWLSREAWRRVLTQSLQYVHSLSKCVRLSRPLGGFWTHFKSPHFDSFIHFIHTYSYPAIRKLRNRSTRSLRCAYDSRYIVCTCKIYRVLLALNLAQYKPTTVCSSHNSRCHNHHNHHNHHHLFSRSFLLTRLFQNATVVIDKLHELKWKFVTRHPEKKKRMLYFRSLAKGKKEDSIVSKEENSVYVGERSEKAIQLFIHTGWLKKVSCYHSTTAYFFEPPCIYSVSQKSSPPKTFSDIFTCGESV